MAGPTVRSEPTKDESTTPRKLKEQWQVHASNGAPYGFPYDDSDSALEAAEASALPGAYLSKVYRAKGE